MSALNAPGASDLSGRSRALDMRGLIDVFQRRLWLFLIVAGVVLAATILASLIIPPKFTAEASLKIDPSHHSSINTEAAASSQTPDSSAVDTEVSVLRSREVAADVVRALNLVNDPELGPKKRTANDQDKAVEVTIDHLGSALAVGREGATYIVDVKATTKDAAKSARIANATVQAYIDFSNRSRAKAAEDQTSALTQRLSSLGAEVKDADARVAQYRSATGTVTGSGTSGTVTDQQIPTVAAQLALAQAQAAALRSKAEAARRQVASGSSEAVGQVLDSSVITDLRRQRTEIVREQAQIMARYGPRHPDYIRVANQLAQLDKQITDETNRIISGQQSDANAAESQAASLGATLNALRARQSSDSQASVQADSLQRDAEAKRTIFNQINQAAQESAQLAQLGDTQTRVVATATTPTKPSFPNKPLFAALGAVIGFVAGAAAVFVADALDPTIQTLDDVETNIGLPFIAATQYLSRAKLQETGKDAQPWDFVTAKPLSTFAEAFRTIRAKLLVDGAGGPGKIVMITSALPAEGKTVSSVSLARIMALSGDRTILIDCDLRRNSLRNLTDGADQGLVEVLSGAAPLDAVIQKDTATDLDLLPLSGRAFTAQDKFGGGGMAQLLETLRSRYDFIVLDGPPVLAVTDAQTLAPMVDGVILIAKHGKTPEEALRGAVQRLEGASIVGVVISQVKAGSFATLGPRSSLYYNKAYSGYYVD